MSGPPVYTHEDEEEVRQERDGTEEASGVEESEDEDVDVGDGIRGRQLKRMNRRKKDKAKHSPSSSDPGSSSPSPPAKLRRRKNKTVKNEKKNKRTLFFAGGIIRYDREAEAATIRKGAHKATEQQEGLERARRQGGIKAREWLRLKLILQRVIPQLGIEDLRNASVWRAAFIEFVGTLQMTFFSCAVVITVLRGKYDPPAQAIALVHVALLGLYILAVAAASGGHLNPLITLSTVLTRLSSVVRGILYVIGQCLGAIAGAALIRFVVGEDIAQETQIGACIMSKDISQGRAFVLEVMFDFFLLFISYGVALDPTQGQVYGPIFAPFFVSTTLGLCIFASSLLATPPYTGAGLNPSRCLGPAVAIADLYDWDGTWVYYFGPLVAAVLHALVYNLMPPQHALIYQEIKATAHKKHQERISQRNLEPEVTKEPHAFV